jgi:hypothetical protein
MAENKKSFWTTLPGIISGIAAIVTALGVLIPLALGVGRHSPSSSSQQPSPGASSSAGTTSTAGNGGTASPLPSGDSAFPGQSQGSASGITADPPSVGFGSIQQGKSTPDKMVTITNPGGVAVTIDKVEVTGANASAFGITSTTCGEGAIVAPQGSCTISLHFTPNQIGSGSASLVVHYEPPASSFSTIQLSGSGSLL